MRLTTNHLSNHYLQSQRNKPMENFKLTLWKRTGKNSDGSTFTNFSGQGIFNGEDCWWNGYPKEITKKDGTKVDVIEVVIKPKTPKAGGDVDLKNVGF